AALGTTAGNGDIRSSLEQLQPRRLRAQTPAMIPPGPPPATSGLLSRSTGSARKNGAVKEIDRLEEAIAECRELIREAHGVTKDLRTAVREAKEEIQGLAKDRVAETVATEVTRQ